MQDMVAVMSKLQGLGMSLPDLIRRSTAIPAAIIGRPELGRISEGGEADLAIFGVSSGPVGLIDTENRRIDATGAISCEITIRAGQVLWDRNGRTKPPWVPALK